MMLVRCLSISLGEPQQGKVHFKEPTQRPTHSDKDGPYEAG